MPRPDITEEEFEARLAAGRPDISEEEFEAKLAAGRPDISEEEFDARLAAGGPQKDWRGWKDGDRPADFVASNEEPPVTWGEGFQSWGKMMDPGAGIKSLNLLTGAQTLEQQTPTARELDSSNALVGPAAAGVATGLLAGPAQVGFIPAILASNAAGGGARMAYNMAALDQPAGEAFKNAATDPVGVAIDTLAGGIGGYTPFLRGATRATGNVSNQIRKILPGNKHFKGADLMSAHPEKASKLQESDIVMPQTPEQAAAARVTDEGIAPLTGTDGSVLPNEASVLAPRRSAPVVPEIERAVAVREGLEAAAETDPRQVLVNKRIEAENALGAAKASLLARKSQLNAAASSSFDDQIDMLNQADDIPQLGGGQTTKQLEDLVEQAQANLDEIMSVDAYGNPVKLNEAGANVRVIADEAKAARAAYDSGKSGGKGFLGRSWDILTGKEPILGGFTAPNENMRKLVKKLDKQLADPKLTGAKRQELQAQRDVANAARQNIYANETIRKRVIGEFQVKFGKGLDQIEAQDLVDTTGPKGERLPSNIFRALDGDEKAYKALSEKSKKGFEEIRLTMDEFYEAEVRSGLTQSVEPDVIANLRADDDYWQDLISRRERVGFDIVPPNLTPEQAIELSKAGKLSGAKFREVAEGLGFKVDPDATGNKLLVPLLRKQSYVQHRALPMSPEAAANRDAFLRLKYPHKSSSEIDTMVNAGGDRPILMSQRESEDLTGLNTDILDVIDGMTNSGAENIANAATWGGLQSKGVQSVMGDTGGNVKQLPMSAVKILETLPDGPKKESMRKMFTRKYNLEVNPQSGYLRALGRGVSGSQLTYAGLTSGSELHKAVSMMGGARAIPFGRAYVKAMGNENVNELWKQSGAAQSPIYDQITGVTQKEIRKATESGFLDPLKGMQQAENFLREQGSYGNLWYIDDIARRAADQASAGKPFSGRILQEASEVFPTAASPEAAAKRLADEYIATDGQMSQELFKEGISELTQGQFYTTALGFIGDQLKASGPGVILAYKPFMIQAQRMFNQRVMAPFFRGLATGDPGLVALGAGRAMKMAPTAAATASVSATLRSIATGRYSFRSEEERAKDIERRTNDLFFGGVMGFEGDLFRGAKELVVDGDPTRLGDQGSIPALSQGRSIWEAAAELLGSGASEDDIQWSKVAGGVGDVLSMGDSRVNLFMNPIVEKLAAEEAKESAREKLLQRRR